MRVLKNPLLALFIIFTIIISSSCNVQNDHTASTKSIESAKKDSVTPEEASKKIAGDQLAADEMYTCNMHNEVMSDHPGKCPKCGMNLVKLKMTDKQKQMMKDGTYEKPKE